VIRKETLGLREQIVKLAPYEIYGTVSGVQGLVITVHLRNTVIGIGARCSIYPPPESMHHAVMKGEVVGFSDHGVLLMPFGSVQGIGPGCRVVFHQGEPTISPSMSWCGRVINALAEPIDDLGALPEGDTPYPIQAYPIMSSKRARVVERLDVGIRAINTFLTCCKGQRMGIFAGSGVGKSMLLSMFARHTACDICVIGLVGERGREVKDFIEETLGAEGLKRSVLVVATSDESPLMRRQAAFLTLSLAEYYRDQGLSVLCLMDSVTRFAMAQREIGLSAGEPPTTKGYTPSVFAELPRLLERAGPGLQMPPPQKTGYITGLFTVLVDGDDTNEPISDAVRGILDGHIILERSIAERGRFPAINILKSISRTVPGCHAPAEQTLVKGARALIASYEDMADMIRLGAYREGSNAQVDAAIAAMPLITEFLTQSGNEVTSLEESFERLGTALHNE
jgi:flagellum-specific ATP synthase